MQDRVVAITGASGALGRAVVAEAAERGARLALVDHAGARRGSGGRHDPDRGSGADPFDADPFDWPRAALNDGAAADEADAHDQTLDDAAQRVQLAGGVLHLQADDRQHGGAEAHERMRAEPRRFPAKFAIGADRGAAGGRHAQTHDEVGQRGRMGNGVHSLMLN